MTPIPTFLSGGLAAITPYMLERLAQTFANVFPRLLSEGIINVIVSDTPPIGSICTFTDFDAVVSDINTFHTEEVQLKLIENLEILCDNMVNRFKYAVASHPAYESIILYNLEYNVEVYDLSSPLYMFHIGFQLFVQ